MSDRKVTQTKKDKDGDITALCNPDYSKSWSPRWKKDVITDIENGDHQYFVQWAKDERTEIEVVNGPNGQYLRTVRDGHRGNNLDNLPDC